MGNSNYTTKDLYGKQRFKLYYIDKYNKKTYIGCGYNNEFLEFQNNDIIEGFHCGFISHDDNLIIESWVTRSNEKYVIMDITGGDYDNGVNVHFDDKVNKKCGSSSGNQEFVFTNDNRIRCKHNERYLTIGNGRLIMANKETDPNKEYLQKFYKGNLYGK